MSLNKHKIIPLIESYYHTFTPLERTIADFFHVLPKNVDFMGTENLFMSINKVWPQALKKIFRILKFLNLTLIRNFLINPMLYWIRHRLHGSPNFWYPNLVFMSMAEAVPDLPRRK